MACGSSSSGGSPSGGAAGKNEAGGDSATASGGTTESTGEGGKSALGSGGMGHGGDASEPLRAGSGGSAGGGVCNQTLDNQACWSSYSINDLTQNTPGLYGAIFDGRRIVFPNGTSAYEDHHLQFDTQGDFQNSWKSFNSNPEISNGYRGGTFDGRYIYFTPTLPEHNGAAAQTYDSVAARYDTQADFGSLSSWTSFNLTQKSGTEDLTVPGYRGAAFDGHYVYFAPSWVGDTPSGNATRYDTTGPFDDKASWTDFDLATIDVHAVNFDGAVLAGKYLYFVPGLRGSLAMRYDTTASFTDKASWSSFSTETIDAKAANFGGGVFDGRYLYFVPDHQTEIGYITRYDTQASFEDASSWAIYNPIGTGFTDSLSFGGAAWDGRFVYFVPTAADFLVRYDPKLPFDSASAWVKHRMTSQASGAIFDGHYLYVVPRSFGSVFRYEARAASDPGPTQASFY